MAEPEGLEDVLGRLERSGEELARVTSQLVRMPTVNPPGTTTDLVAYIDSYLRTNGIETAVHELVPGKANLCATVPGRGEGKLLWLGHIDVVPPGNLDTWERDAFSGDLVADRVYGRGTTDMKGGDAAAMVVATALGAIGDQLGPTVEFWFTCDEEIGGVDGARLLAQRGYFSGDACIIGDGWSGPRPSLDIGCKGGMGTTLRAKGRAGHASRPFLGDNAIDKLVAAIPYARRIADFRLDLPEELYAIARESGDELIESGGLTGEQAEAARRAFLYPTVSLSIVSGGIKSNVIPDEATAIFDIRLTPGCDRDKVRDRMIELVASAGIEGVSVEIRPGVGSLHGSDNRPLVGYYESPEHPFVKQMSAAVARVTGETARLKVLTGGTDGVSLHHIAGIPCVGFGAGLPELAHGPNEYVTIANLVRAAKIYAAAPLMYQRQPGAAQ